MNCLVKVQITDNDSTSLMLNKQREIALELRRQQLCTDFIPVNRTNLDCRVDCYLFDIVLSKEKVTDRYSEFFKGQIIVDYIEELSIDWKLVKLAGRATDLLLSRFLDKHTRHIQLASYFVHRLTILLGANHFLNIQFLENIVAYSWNDDYLTALVNEVAEILLHNYSDINERYKSFRCYFLHYIMNSLGETSAGEIDCYNLWFIDSSLKLDCN